MPNILNAALVWKEQPKGVMGKNRSARLLEYGLLSSHAIARTWDFPHPCAGDNRTPVEKEPKEGVTSSGIPDLKTFTHLFLFIQWFAYSMN